MSVRLANVVRLANSVPQTPSDRDAVSDLKRRVMGSVLAASPERPGRIPFRDMLSNWILEPVAASVAIAFGALLGVLRVML